MAPVAVGILGASGYGGAGLIRRLSRHPQVELAALGSRQYGGQPLAACWPQLAGVADLEFGSNEETIEASEVIFAATPHGATAPLVKCAVDRGLRVIDLSADFRLPPERYAEWYGGAHPHPDLYEKARYGLVELHRADLAGAELVASPGCNATAASLALAPLAAAGWLGADVTITIVTGVSGAGRSVNPGLHFGEVNENARAYKVAGGHRHIAEIEATLGRAAAMGKEQRTHAPFTTPTVSFTPVVVPMTRGILASCVTRPDNAPDEAALFEHYRTFYRDDPLVQVQTELPHTKPASGSDRAIVTVRRDPRDGSLLALCAIDNLGKGAAGQAVQGFNAAFGFEETLGLDSRGVWP